MDSHIRGILEELIQSRIDSNRNTPRFFDTMKNSYGPFMENTEDFILGYTIGSILANFYSVCKLRFQTELSHDEHLETWDILKRRIPELKLSILDTQ